MHLRYKYGPKKTEALISLIVGLGMALASIVALSVGARFGRRGYYMSAENSVWVFLLLTAVGLVLLINGVLLARTAIARPGEVVVTPTLISAPHSDYSAKPDQTNPATITEIKPIMSNEDELGMEIVSPSGKIKLLRKNFHPQADYQACVEAVRQCAAAAQQPPPHPTQSVSTH